MRPPLLPAVSRFRLQGRFDDLNSFVWFEDRKRFCLHHSFSPSVLSLTASDRPHYGLFLSPQALAGSGVFETGSEDGRSQGCNGGISNGTTSKKVDLMLKREGRFSVFRVFHDPHGERAFASPPQSPLRLLRRAASFYFRPYVPLLLPGARPSFHLNVLLLHRRRRRRRAPLLYRRTRWDLQLLQLLRSGLIILQGHS